MEITSNQKPETSNQKPATKHGQTSLLTLPSVSILRSIFDNLSTGIVINDENFNIVYINKYLSNIEKPPVMAGQGCYKSLNSSGRHCIGCPIKNKNKTENISPVSFEVIGTRSQVFMVNTQPIELENGKRGLLEWWVDITKSKNKDSRIYDRAFELESRVNEQVELIEAQRNAMVQQDKLASMGKLVAGVAHEINNPVVFIRSNIEILKKYWEKFEPVLSGEENDSKDKKIGRLSFEQLVKDVPDILDSMYRGTDRIKNIVSNLKSFSRKDAEVFTKEKIGLENVIKESVSLVHGQIKNKMKVINNIEKNLPCLSGNARRLDQVFVNLFLNSFDAGATELTISSKKEFNNIVIEVYDNGSGIPKDRIEKIFDPFFTTKGMDGTGLGLSISFGIVKEHNGSIHVSSEHGKGTTFAIKLPYEAKTILVVDDDLIILDIVEKVLLASGFLVELATNGKKAVEKMKNIEPCLILTDIHMPEMDGFELIDWLRKDEKYNKIPVLVMTGVEKEIKKIDSFTISDYIVKPFSTKILANTIRSMLEEK